MMDDHDLIADRLLHQVPYAPPPDRPALIAEAAAHATLALAAQTELRNLIAAAGLAADLEHPFARLILLRSIRRRLRLFPPLTTDGEHENGGA